MPRKQNFENMKNNEKQILDSILAQLSAINKHGNRRKFEQLRDRIKRLYPKNCTWPVPKNRSEIVCGHNIANNPSFVDDFRKIIKLIRAIEPDYQGEILKIADFKKLMKKFDPLRLLLKLCPAPLPEKAKIFVN